MNEGTGKQPCTFFTGIKDISEFEEQLSKFLIRAPDKKSRTASFLSTIPFL
jgi:hypothetical protein